MQFNPLDGVRAISSFEGDFTDKVTYIGAVDFNSETLINVILIEMVR